MLFSRVRLGVPTGVLRLGSPTEDKRTIYHLSNANYFPRQTHPLFSLLLLSGTLFIALLVYQKVIGSHLAALYQVGLEVIQCRTCVDE
jgi:hypothetical protein